MVVEGRVQGVFFRDSARREAQRLEVTGSIANLPDGRVEAFFEGSEGSVTEMIDWCYEGPAYAEVTQVTVTDEEPEGTTGFTVA